MWASPSYSKLLTILVLAMYSILVARMLPSQKNHHETFILSVFWYEWDEVTSEVL